MVAKLVNHVPKPAIGEHHVEIGRKDDTKELSVILPAFNALVKRRPGGGVEMPEAHFFVEHAEDMVVVDEVGDGLGGRPSGAFEEAFGEMGETVGVHGVDFADVTFPNVAVEVDDEVLDQFGNWSRANWLLQKGEEVMIFKLFIAKSREAAVHIHEYMGVF